MDPSVVDPGGAYTFQRTKADMGDVAYSEFYNVSAVSSTSDTDWYAGATSDFNGGGVDQFVSFKVDMMTLIQAVALSTGETVDENTPIMFLVATSLQDNAFNQDLAGQGGSVDFRNSSLTWDELGAASDPYTASGDSPVPEQSPMRFSLVHLPLQVYWCAAAFNFEVVPLVSKRWVFIPCSIRNR
ncbi:MAG: hypothetical protein ACPGJU_02265 [Coraliomargarita sp.]